jgi:hypothetical protein
MSRTSRLRNKDDAFATGASADAQIAREIRYAPGPGTPSRCTGSRCGDRDREKGTDRLERGTIGV